MNNNIELTPEVLLKNYQFKKHEMALNILVVEDEYIIQMYLRKIIAYWGHNVIGTADQCEECLLKVEKYDPDLILMDISIYGNKDGIETAKIINNKYKVPIIFITANSDQSTITRALDTNPISIINKPINEDILKNEINKVMPRKQMA